MVKVDTAGKGPTRTEKIETPPNSQQYQLIELELKKQSFKNQELEPIQSPESDAAMTRSDIATVDDLVADLLIAVARYEEVANSDFRSAFVDGFQNLSRANFSANYPGRRFGMDLFDMRVHPAAIAVERKQDTSDMILIAQTEVAVEQKNKGDLEDAEGAEKNAEKNSEASTTRESPKVTTDGDEKIQQKTLAQDPRENTLRNRKNKNALKDQDVVALTEDVARLSLKPYNPMAQFGALVPVQLRHAQSNFRSGLTLAVELANLQRRIACLTEQIRRVNDSIGSTIP